MTSVSSSYSEEEEEETEEEKEVEEIAQYEDQFKLIQQFLQNGPLSFIKPTLLTPYAHYETATMNLARTLHVS